MSSGSWNVHLALSLLGVSCINTDLTIVVLKAVLCHISISSSSNNDQKVVTQSYGQLVSCIVLLGTDESVKSD